MTTELDKIVFEVAHEANEYAEKRGYDEQHQDWCAVRDTYFARRLVAKLSEGQEPVGFFIDGDRGWRETECSNGEPFFRYPPLRQPDAEVLEAMKGALIELCNQREAWYSGDIPTELKDAITNLRAAINKLENKNDQG